MKITAAQARQVTNQSIEVLDAIQESIIMQYIEQAAFEGNSFIKVQTLSESISKHLQSLGYIVEFGYDTFYENNMTCQRSRIKISW